MATRKWAEIRDRLYADPERKRRIEEGVQRRLADQRLGELRRARGFTQRQLAAAMGTPQPSIARLEKQADLYVSTLRSYVEAMGGELHIVASFPDGAVMEIADFAGLVDPAEAQDRQPTGDDPASAAVGSPGEPTPGAPLGDRTISALEDVRHGDRPEDPLDLGRTPFERR